MKDKDRKKIAHAHGAALRQLAGLLEAVASLVEVNTEKEAPTPSVQLEPLVPTRRMPSMEAQARALDDAVQSAQSSGIPKPVP